MLRRDIIRAELEKIQDVEGRLTPEVLLQAAEPAAHPLHALFEWDDTAAGRLWRLAQARGLLRVRMVTRLEERRVIVPVFVRDPAADSHEQGYRSVLAIAGDAADSAAVLVAEIDRLIGQTTRARDLAIELGAAGLFNDVLAALDQARSQLGPRELESAAA